MMCVKAITVRFHLSHPAGKQAWEKLNALRSERHQSFSQLVAEAVNAHCTENGHLSGTEKDELVQEITESVALRLQQMLPAYLAGYSAGASTPSAVTVSSRMVQELFMTTRRFTLSAHSARKVSSAVLMRKVSTRCL